MTKFEVEWIDREREPQCDPNPNFPEGIDVDLAKGAKYACKVPLPYPAKRCGIYLVKCATCEAGVALTTAGRPDDPRSVRIMCRKADQVRLGQQQ